MPLNLSGQNVCPSLKVGIFMKKDFVGRPQSVVPKGQIKSKADWCAIDSPKKGTNEFGFFCHDSPEILKF